MSVLTIGATAFTTPGASAGDDVVNFTDPANINADDATVATVTITTGQSSSYVLVPLSNIGIPANAYLQSMTITAKSAWTAGASSIQLTLGIVNWTGTPGAGSVTTYPTINGNAYSPTSVGRTFTTVNVTETKTFTTVSPVVNTNWTYAARLGVNLNSAYMGFYFTVSSGGSKTGTIDYVTFACTYNTLNSTNTTAPQQSMLGFG